MKTNMLAVVICLAVAGCREERSPDLCLDEYGVVTEIRIESDCSEGERDGPSFVTARDSTDTSAYALHAYAFNSRGTGIYREVQWQAADSTLVELMPLPRETGERRESRALIRTLADIFDRGGEEEPSTTAVACLTNDCADYQEGEDCAPCPLEICSEPSTIKSVLNIEGSWVLEGATFPFPVQLNATQTGHRVVAISSAYAPTVSGRQVTFNVGGDWQYAGEFTDREHVTGEVTRLSTSENLGAWTATKCRQPDCSDL